MDENVDVEGIGVMPYEINNLPTEILQYILSLLSPYRDWKVARLVCKRWCSITNDVVLNHLLDFEKAVAENDLEWQIGCGARQHTISARYSHCAVYYDKMVYVFGGCTSTNTTFNDLWKLDLSTRTWIRPIAEGNYPSPKACASMVVYKDLVILFGGWSHPTPYPLHQAARFFNQVHTYSAVTNRWCSIPCINSPPGKAGHAASIIQDSMIVFGGSDGHGLSSDEIWVLDLLKFEWTKHVSRPNPKPRSRYGHQQITIDDEHLLIIGGCGGPNMQFNDVWLLSMDTDPWHWQEVTITGQANAPPQIWCHATCKVSNYVVVLSKATTPPGSRPITPPPQSDPRLRTTQLAQLSRALPDSSESSGQDSSSDTDDTSRGGRAVGMWSGRSQPGGSNSNSSNGRSQQMGGASAMDTTSQYSSQVNNSPVSSVASSYIADGQSPGTSSQAFLGASPSASPSTSTSPQALSGTSPSSSRYTSTSPQALPAASPSSSHYTSTSPQALPGASTSASPSTSSSPQVLPSTSTAYQTPQNLSPQPSAIPGPSNVTPFRVPFRTQAMKAMPSIRPNASKNRQKQLDMLRRYEEKLRGNLTPSAVSKVARRPRNCMYTHTLDISNVLTRLTACWIPLKENGSGPEETIFYTLVCGRGELVMFGGIQADFSSMQKGLHVENQEVTNALHILKAKRFVH